MGSKKKKKQKQNQNKGLFVQWGVPVTVLVIVIIFLISNFTITSKNSAQETINKQLTSEIEAYASALKSEFTGLYGTAAGAASIIGAQGYSEETAADYAAGITRVSGNIYMTVITDRDGKGVADNGSSVDISGFEYFNINNSVKYSYVKDNGITGSEAFVCATPVAGSEGLQGMIYMFINPSGIMASLPSNNYGGGVGYALITPNGDILYTTGSPSTFTGGTNLFTNLEGAAVEGLTIAQIKLRAEKQNRMIFSSTKGTESRTVAIAPVFVDGWQLMAAINQKYVDNVVYSEMKNARKMITNLAIAIGVFLLFLVANAIINRIKYGEESKDLADKADTDLLTELNNKIATERKIQEWMNENPGVQCLMFLFDIDNFKKINDTMGHAFGDEVLRTLGHQLRNEFRVTDIIGRLGGDEFVLFLKGIKSDDQLQREGERITNFFHQFRAGDYVKYSATASIGGVVVPRDATNFQDAYKAADVALYEAKRRGKNQLVFYSKDLANVESIRVSDEVEPLEDYRRI